jgi:hypothetical protein
MLVSFALTFILPVSVRKMGRETPEADKKAD